MHRLVFQSGPRVWEIRLKPGLNSIGRSSVNDVAIEDPSISSAHCEIEVGVDSVCVRDLGSTNGTFVNDAPVREGVLLPGQLLRVGNVELRFQAGEEAARPAEAGPRAQPRGAAGAAFAATGGAYAALAAGGLALASVEITPGPVAKEAAAEKPIFCRNHYQNLARFRCGTCGRFFCDLCVNTRGTAGGGLKFCKVCGVECVGVAVKPLTRPVRYFEEARQAFRYPFLGDGWILLLGGTFFFGFLDLANYVARTAFGFALRAMMMRVVIFTFILGTGYLFSYLKKIIAATAERDDRMPDWPELSEWKEDIVSPMFQFVMISLLSFGPALVAYLWSDGDYPWAVWLVALVGCVYFPMALLGVAVFDTLAVLDPRFTVGSILKVPREYGLAAGVFAGIIGVRWLCESGLSLLMPIPVIPALLSDLVMIVLLMVEARILGLLYLSQKARLGWFKR